MNLYRLGLSTIAAFTLLTVVLLVAESERQYPKYSDSGSGVRISSVAYPTVFFALAWSHVCLAAILLATTRWSYLAKIAIGVAVVGFWAYVIDRYANESGSTASRFLVAGFVIYLGLSLGRRRGPGESRWQDVARRYLHVSTGGLLGLIAWIALWIALEHRHVQQIGLLAVIMSYMSSSLPFAMLSIALVWAVNSKQSTANSAPPLTVTARFLMAIGIGIGFVALGTCINTAQVYVWLLLNGHSHPPTLANSLRVIGLRSPVIVLCGGMIVPWLLVVRWPLRRDSPGQDLTSPA